MSDIRIFTACLRDKTSLTGAKQVTSITKLLTIAINKQSLENRQHRDTTTQ
jgi:hypothetical protein